MSSTVRERKPKPSKLEKEHEYDDSKEKRQEQGPDLEPNIFVILSLIAVIGMVATSFFYYKVDNRNQGAFASWVNEQFPSIEKALNRPRASTPLFGAAAQETSEGIKLTEAELKAFDGTDKDKPIYLGIDGKIFDVSASPAFYGPGGHYHHFVGREATRAWVTECWDEEEQFTWRMEGLEEMFRPKWLDEQLSDAAAGKYEDLGDIGGMPKEMLNNMAKKAIEKFGSVTDGEKKRRRVSDKEEAQAKVQETLDHWVAFFAGNAKYKMVGSVIREEKPEPPKICAEAMKKRPMKGGKLETMMGAMGPMMGGAAGAGAGAGGAGGQGQMPEHVKEAIKKKEEERKAAEAVEPVDTAEDDDEDLVHDEL